MLYKFLKNKIQNKKIILLGELHGTKETPELILNFLQQFINEQDFNIALEIPLENQLHIEQYLETGKEDYLKEMPFFKFSENSDGRNSLEYFILIKEIYFINLKKFSKIRVFCIDVNSIEDYKIQNKRETKLAENILRLLSEKILFVIIGSIHASKNILELNNTSIIPAGFFIYKRLKDKFLSVLLWPKRGEYFNLGIKEQKPISNIDKLAKNYDYTYFIEKITPCTFLK